MQRIGFRLACALIAHAIGGFAVHGSGPANAAPPALPTPAESVARVAEAVREAFYDADLSGVDWPAAQDEALGCVHSFAGEAVDQALDGKADAARRRHTADCINRMLRRLGASHTRFFTRDDSGFYFLVDLFGLEFGEPMQRYLDKHGLGGDVAYAGIGVFTRESAGRTFVDYVVDGGPAAASGVRHGDRVVDVDGAPWQGTASFTGRVGSPVTLRLQRRPETEPFTIDVTPQWIRPVEFFAEAVDHSARIIRAGGRNVGYVHVWSYAGRINHDRLEQVLQREGFRQADGLVLDIRGGWGGASPSYLTLFSDRVPELAQRGRDGRWTHWSGQWTKPVVLLVDGASRSGKEILAHGFRKYGYGKVVGSRTGGAVLAGRAIPIGPEGLLYLAVADVRVDGERLEGVGVEPDVSVPFDRRWSAGTDPQLDAAVKTLIEQVEASATVAPTRRPS